jgi:crotonobetainyl-CoA:carnitine CoA-transferase CaiB-like acyl-CoA transferase
MSPLEGIRVVDLSTVIFGPLASQTLGEYGADVIKVEAPAGDSTRFTGVAAERGMSAVFLGVNRSKRSVVLDLKQAAARDALLALVDGADVFMHSMRPQKLDALGLGSDALRARNPRLVFAGLHGFADGGPYAGRPAYDDIVQGLSGAAALVTEQWQSPGYFPTIAADKTCGMIAVHAILAALVQRGRTGAGCHVEIPMFESMTGFNMVDHLYGKHFEPPRGPCGYPRTLARWRRPYASADGHVCMMPYTDAHWRRFFVEAGRPELADDPRFADIGARTENVQALYALLAEIIATRTTAEWLDCCERLEIPAGPMNRLDDLFDDPHLAATGYFRTLEDPSMGTLRFAPLAVRIDGEAARVDVPPRLGEHTRDVLAQAGLAPATIDALIASGAARD